jgi:hypothetical protein
MLDEKDKALFNYIILNAKSEFTIESVVAKTLDISQNRKLIERVSIFLEEEGFITVHNTTFYTFKLSEKGRVVKKLRGYENYFEHVESEAKKIKAKEDAEFESARSTAELNTWLLKTRWLPHILSGLAIIISVIALLISLKDDKKESDQNQTKTITLNR